ncbi:hypothetical protein PPL_01602 [Heterostelium album PN500]|uniref:Uncharacterized protein n=1 Tax=Heterostelium pallidum (strain ATCC 26659 / Pp 5 / PN500) TaxID=670386 RepID=D3AZY8_HETP5|nr:hypothetical protein PPL_01602 [Heterostelium album PN500]EFA84612.1 hypothetical protein PPL_01602 [Heterostelium album PN500]|eukprot:XP_020436725.1 hypothetical protein PPL_01602 [Heterostelium album PN500]
MHELSPYLPAIFPYLGQLMDRIEQIIPQLDYLAPYLQYIIPNLDELLPNIGNVLDRNRSIVPYIQDYIYSAQAARMNYGSIQTERNQSMKHIPPPPPPPLAAAAPASLPQPVINHYSMNTYKLDPSMPPATLPMYHKKTLRERIKDKFRKHHDKDEDDIAALNDLDEFNHRQNLISIHNSRARSPTQ